MKNYFKKFSIMFVMLLSVIGGGIISNGNVANAATVGQQLLQPEAGWKRFDDADTNISYIGTGWYVGNYAGAQSDMVHANPSAGEVHFNFTGTKLRIISNTASTGFSDNITISIDGTIINKYSEIANSSNFRILLYENTSLENKEHTVKISKPADGKYIEMDAIDIDSVGILKPYNENISISASNITLNKITDDLKVGQADSLVATITPDNTTNKNITWVSSDPTIATVDNLGNITAVKEGKAIITATTKDGSNLSASCTVAVTNQTTPTSGITLNKTTDSINVGETDTLVATAAPAGSEIVWTSSDPSIATVDSTGKVIAIKEGQVTITAQIKDSETKATCAVNVSASANTGGTGTPTTGDANLFIELVDGNIKQYAVSSSEIDDFIIWYNNRDNDDAEKPYFKFTKGSYTDYVVHDKIDWFEVR